jgi:hypothetical protein
MGANGCFCRKLPFQVRRANVWVWSIVAEALATLVWTNPPFLIFASRRDRDSKKCLGASRTAGYVNCKGGRIWRMKPTTFIPKWFDVKP